MGRTGPPLAGNCMSGWDGEWPERSKKPGHHQVRPRKHCFPPWPGRQPPTISKGLIKQLGGLVSPTRCAAAQAGRAASRPQREGEVLLCWVKVLQAPPGPPERALSGSQTAAIPAGPCKAHLFTVRGQCPSGSIARQHALRPHACAWACVHPGTRNTAYARRNTATPRVHGSLCTPGNA